ncbi:MAG: nuclear transport factor 2 family protein [Devosia nanyangense]|uniref:Nuclear transport factor 2 family protein n=1 Tax=Devosia nanyangense TaxID=1228055 RepID=A0A933L160_9HYPH|nr:nuclear transport factor 2 family protein [Devosia nanyangense]
MGFGPRSAAELADLDCLERLVTTYSRAIDRRDFALLRSLYHDDAVEEHGEMFSGSPDAYVDFVRTALAGYAATAHYVVHSLFELDGDAAEGETYKINYHRTHGADAREVITGSRSLDRFARRDGEWRFLRRSVVIDWARTRPADASAYDDFAAGSPHGSPGAGDLSYVVLELLGRRGD